MSNRKRSEKPKGKGNFATHKEKWLTVIMVILAICVIGLVIAVIILAFPKDQRKEKPCLNDNCLKAEKPCLNDNCLKAAVSTMDKMDRDVKPCNDFWKCSCGGFIKRNPVFPFENKTMYSSFHEISTKVNKELMVLLTEENTKDTIAPVKHIKKLFSTCVDPDMNETVTVQETIMKAIEFGGVPIVTGYMNENFTRIDLLTHFSKFFATYSFLHFDVKRNIHSGNGNILYLNILPTHGTEIINKVIVNLAKEANQTDSYNITEITNFMDTYKELVDSVSAIDFQTYIQNKPRNISEILKNFPEFDLESYINAMLSIGDTRLENDSAIVIFNEEQIQNLTSLISNTSLETLLNIMFTSLVIEFQSVLEPSLSSNSKLHGENLNTENTRANHCLKLCKIYAPRVMGKMYVRRYFPEEYRKKSNELAYYLSKALISVLENTNWLDDKSREAVLDKAKVLINSKSIGYDPSLIDDEFLKKRFENVTVNDHLLNNIFEYNKALLRRAMKLFTETLSNDSSIINSFHVNAQYNPTFNTISLPSAILQPPIFDVNVPQEINFGAAGTIIGHEMMHAFDNTGIMFNENGNIDKLLTNESQAEFDKRKNEFIKEYSQFLMPRVNETVNGSLTVGENIADISGIKVSYLAYTMWKKDKSEETIPGFNMTSEQLFFTAFSQVWCEIRSKDMIEAQLKTNVHSPARARTIVTLQNFKEFSNAYNCSTNTYMYLPNRIELW